ncbi:MAG TPA: DoxX family protein [Gemmatimonadota bacterium]|jgi:putative oxidoreductase
MRRSHWIATLARVFCGVVFIVHGYPKIMNLAGTATFFSENVGIPGWIAVPIAILEFFGGILLIAGFASRILAVLFILEMLGAMLFVNFERGWDVFEGGYEYNIALVILLLVLIMLGAGPISVDGAIARRRGGETVTEGSGAV